MKDIITKITENKGYTEYSLKEIFDKYFNKPNISDGKENILYDLIMYVASKKPSGAAKQVIEQAMEIVDKMGW